MVEAEYIGKEGHYWVKRPTREEVEQVIKTYHPLTTIEEWTFHDTIDTKIPDGGESALLS